MDPIVVEVAEDDSGMRLDALVARAAGVSRARAAELVSTGRVSVDGRDQPKAYRVSAGERIETRPLETVRAGAPVPVVPVVHEDAEILVVDKPAGVVVHPGGGVRSGTVVDALLAAGKPLAPRAGEDRPGIVHRLDKDVSGLMLVAKTDEAHEELVAAIAARRVRREYLAGVAGVPAVDAGKIDAPVGRHPRHRTRMAVLAEGKPSTTWFRVRERLSAAALLEVRLETGRTHQIRTHLASIGHPIVGDQMYGRDPGVGKRAALTRPFLHAFRLRLEHPVHGGELELQSALPPDLERALERMRG